MVRQSSDITLVLASLAGLLFVGTKRIASEPPMKSLVNSPSFSSHLKSTWSVIGANSAHVENLSKFSHSFLSKLDGEKNFIRQVVRSHIVLFS